VLPVGYSYDIITLSITLDKIKKKIHSRNNQQLWPYKGVIEIYKLLQGYTNTKSITGLKVVKTTF